MFRPGLYSVLFAAHPAHHISRRPATAPDHHLNSIVSEHHGRLSRLILRPLRNVVIAPNEALLGFRCGGPGGHPEHVAVHIDG